MTLIIVGVILWSVLHLFPALAHAKRITVIEKIGIGKYKLLFTLLIFASIACMVFGWRNTAPELLYVASWLPLHLAYVLIYSGVFLMVASGFNTRVKQLIRHPQLTGFAIWAAMHALLNGDTRALVLFGGLALWAIIEIFALNVRDGEWHKPQPPSRLRELKPLLTSVALFALLFFIHPYLSGKALVF
ncbi:MAG: NnrU family protein [Gammaproteobacteria bacterium]|nr:NnrU family protein [Gammaproteobacteria bacterium]NND39757.1 NnrU protein [Pseudomonadales bacterium]NNM10429.1 NnrU protein [Pseudomonadales bacterium]